HEYMMVRQYDRVLFSQRDPETAVQEVNLPINSEWTVAVKKFHYKLVSVQDFEESADVFAWYLAGEEEPQLQIRSRKPGDRISLAGMSNPKKVARLMIDEKVPAPFRKGWPVITDSNDEILLMPGLRPSRHISAIQRPEDIWVLM